MLSKVEKISMLAVYRVGELLGKHRLLAKKQTQVRLNPDARPERSVGLLIWNHARIEIATDRRGLETMYCIKCGHENREDASFCKKCGEGLDHEPEEETRVVSRVEGDAELDEPKIFSIRPTLMFVKMGYALAVIAAFLFAALLATIVPILSLPVSSLLVVGLGISFLLIPAYYHIRQKTVLYTLTDSKVEIDEGLLSKTTRNVPLRIIQDVTVSANFFQRVMGFGDVEIENANENDELIVLKNISSPKKYAATLLEQMRRLDKK